MRALTATSSMTLLLAVSVGGAAGPPPRRDAKVQLEAIAHKLSFFQTHMFIYDSDSHEMPDEVYATYEKAMRPIYRRTYPVASLLPLVKHPDARVRTLAAAGLYAYENPRLLLELVPLLEDRAKTFPEVDDPANFRMVARPNQVPPRKQQQVRDVARRFLEVYLEAAGYSEGIAPDNGKRGLADYWARRKDRTYCASWFAVRVLRASRGCSPPSEDDLGAVRAIRKEIDRLPEVDRAVTLLWLWSCDSGSAAVSEKELVEVCKTLGPDRLLDLLKRKPPSTDPDLGGRGFDHFAQGIRVVILPNAKHLLRPDDADTLLACASIKGNYPWAEWFIAAADLRPKRAAEILDRGWMSIEKGMFSGDDRMRLTLARWRLVPLEGTAPVLKRFYDEPIRYASFPHAQALFLCELGKGWEPRDRELLVALVRDKRFATLDWQSLDELV